MFEIQLNCLLRLIQFGMICLFCKLQNLVQLLRHFIRITCSCDPYPLTLHFYMVKLGFAGMFIFSSPEPLGSQGELIVYTHRAGVRPSVVRRRRRPTFTMLKDLLQNRWADQSQIVCGAALGRGNDILFAASGSHDQDGRHAHLW